MMVPLTTTLDATQAHIAAGVLEAHDIPVEVEGDIVAGWYPIPALGGVRLMVREEDVEAAREVLNTLPAEPVREEEEPVQKEPGFSLDSSLGTGLLCGLWMVPLLVVAAEILHLVMSALLQIGKRIKVPYTSELFTSDLPFHLLRASLWGAVVGLMGGLTVWLVGSYRQKHPAGVTFIFLVALICSGLMELVLMLVFWLLKK